MRDKAFDIVCIHGAGGGGWEWAIWARVLAARGHAVLAPDLRAIGAGLEATRYRDYREQVLGWLDGLGGDRPCVVIGASLGGLLAIDVANTAAVTALVVVNPLPPAACIDGLPTRDWPDRVRWGSNRSLAGTRDDMSEVDDAACLHAFRRWRDESGAVLREACAGIELSPPPIPALAVLSAADVDVPLRCGIATAQWLAATPIVVPAASHLGPLFGASAAALAWRVADWLAEPTASA